MSMGAAIAAIAATAAIAEHTDCGGHSSIATKQIKLRDFSPSQRRC